MKINGNSFDAVRIERPAPVTGAEQQRPDQRGVQSNGSAAVRADTVEISAAGRSMAGRVESDSKASFDPERVAELRSKVLTGAYNTLDVVDQVARRILSRGDL